MRRSLAFLLLAPLIAMAAPDDKLPPDLAHVPNDALWFVSFRPADVTADPRLRLVSSLFGPGGKPFQSAEDAGVRVSEVDRCTLFQRRGNQGYPVALLRFSKAPDVKEIAKRCGTTTETKLHDRLIRHSRVHDIAFTLLDDKTIMIGMTPALVPALAALKRPAKDHPLAEELRVAAGKHSLVAAIRAELTLRTMDADWPNPGEPEVPPIKSAPPVEKAAPEPPEPGFVRVLLGKDNLEDLRDAPLKLRSFKEITNNFDPHRSSMYSLFAATYAPLAADRILVTLDLGDEMVGTLKAQFHQDIDAEDSEWLFRHSLASARRAGPMYLRMIGMHTDKTGLLDPVIAQVREAISKTTIKRAGKLLSVRIAGKLDLGPILKLIEAEKPLSDATNQMKMLGLGFHSYHDAYNSFPRAICDKAGKPLLSWRVALLPYIEEDKLYKEFKLDEPWDSPHNKKLLAKMPKLYAAPPGKSGDPEPEANTTPFQLFTGPGTLFPRPDSKMRFADVTDGLSNTFLIVEAGKQVPWTKPEDIEMSDKAIPKLGGRFKGVFLVVMGDGSVRRVNIKAGPKALRIFIAPNDGIPTDDKVFEK